MIEDLCGQNLPDNFPVIDKMVDGTVTSIKSIDLNAGTYQDANRLLSKLNGYVDKVAAFNGDSLGEVVVAPADFSSRALELVIPRTGPSVAQQTAIGTAISRASARGVTVIIKKL